MPLDIQSVFGPKKLFTDSQLEIINRMRGDFLLLASKVSEKTHANQMRDKGFEHLKEALHCFERSLTSYTFLTGDVLADAFNTVERKDKRVEHLWVNTNTFCDIRKCRDIFDAKTKIDELRANNQGTVWGAVVHISKLIPDFSVALIGEREENLTRESVPFEAQLYRY